MRGVQRKRSGACAALAMLAVLGGCSNDDTVERRAQPDQSETAVPSTTTPFAAPPTSVPPGTRLAPEQFTTLLRQGRVQSATILRGGTRLAGTYDRGDYWVELAATDAGRLLSAIEDGGVPLAVQPAQPYQGPGIAFRIDQFITLLRQGRIATATVVRAEERIVGSFDRGEYWVAYSGALLDRLTAAIRDAGLPVTER